MRIAFTTKGTNWDSKMDPRFGRTKYLLIFDEVSKELMSFDNIDSAKDAHGVGPKTAQKLFELHADVLITGNGPGENAGTVLQKAGLEIYIGAGELSVKEAHVAFEKGKLKKMT